MLGVGREGQAGEVSGDCAMETAPWRGRGRLVLKPAGSFPWRVPGEGGGGRRQHHLLLAPRVPLCPKPPRALRFLSLKLLPCLKLVLLKGRARSPLFSREIPSFFRSWSHW